MQENFTYSIKTDVFEGPLELLIELCEKRKLLINDISLASVTDEYISRVNEMQQRSLPHTAQFVQLAATLLLIKSKSLLPVLELTKEEEASIDVLEERLRLYQIFREGAQKISDKYGATIMYTPRFNQPKETLFHPDQWCTTTSLYDAITHIVTNLPKKEAKPRVKVQTVISLEEMIESLKKRIESGITITFSSLQKDASEHKTVIVSFLAVLELIKMGQVVVRQEQHYSDFQIETIQKTTPRY
jgi:segregation and condensation protein A